jgi:hypothetical protein
MHPLAQSAPAMRFLSTSLRRRTPPSAAATVPVTVVFPLPDTPLVATNSGRRSTSSLSASAR